jgi:hypothetical protein
MLMLDIRSNSRSFSPVVRNGWAIKFSVYRVDNILLIFTSCFTGQTIVRYFIDEDKAVNFINYITEHNPHEELVA